VATDLRAAGGRAHPDHQQEVILDAKRFIDKIIDARVMSTSCRLTSKSCPIWKHPREFKDLERRGRARPQEGAGERWFCPVPHQAGECPHYRDLDDTNHEIMDRAPHGERVPLGRPINNVLIYVVDDQLQPVPLGAPGEIVFSGVCVGRGYINDPERTQRAFLQDPLRPGQRVYRSGDYGRGLPDGKLEFLGRRDSQVKISGFRIEIGEIENHLLKLPGVREGAVVVTEGADQNKHLVAFCSGDRPPNPARRDQLAKEPPATWFRRRFCRRKRCHLRRTEDRSKELFCRP
jgi:acyl-CoA synthetase (AMP-forming)/AMP-acid ligase II